MAIVFTADSIYFELNEMIASKHTLMTIAPTVGLYHGIKNHVDLHIHCLQDCVYISKESAFTIESQLKKNRVPYQIIDATLGDSYPGTVLLNAVSTTDFFIHNTDHTYHGLLEDAKKHKLNIINVKQGYTRCTLLPLTNNMFLTSDEGVYKTLLSSGIDTTLIENGPIQLKGHPTGFFAGCCGVVDNVLYVNGDLSLHPSSSIIKSLCQQHHIRIIDVKNKPLTDIGSILTLEGVSI